ncbi:NAD(P)-binding protein [Polyplosphaeria fusca]|uniref:NAD(P)-binding protein n=1 Tax=Polyplosphaeria fusca TaxID=682080 RepID=A0A9P4UW11_9PLEO|nr:NAD(P)-binding protein [Polyplosphaeria fusca]
MSNPAFGFETTAEEVAEAHKAEIPGKTILITGVSPNGLGSYTAKVLAMHDPKLLILASRTLSNLEAAQKEIADVAPSAATRLLELDLGSIAKVREAGQKVGSWDDVPKIDILINNAGIMSTPWALSPDGIESQFATNHIGHFLFTNLLMDKIVAAKGRIVNLSSAGHRFGPVRFEDWNFKDGTEYQPDAAYGQAKSANILHAISLAEKLQSKGVTAYSVHPGGIATNLARSVPIEVLQKKGILDEDGNLNKNAPFKFKSHTQGTATTIAAALDPNIADRSGAYLADCKVDHGEVWEKWAQGQDNAEKLWALSEKLVGEPLDV